MIWLLCLILCGCCLEPSVEIVTVAPNGYTGEADYYCTGVDDQILINAAIKFGSEAYNGAEVHLLRGEYKTSGVINAGFSNIILSGEGKGTVIKKNGNSMIVDCRGTVSTTVSNVTIRRIAFEQVDTNTQHMIGLDYNSRIFIEDNQFTNARACVIATLGAGTTVYLSIRGNIIRNWDLNNGGYAAIVTGGTNTGVIIENNEVDGMGTNHTDIYMAIDVASGGGNDILHCINNNIHDMSSNAAVGVYGILAGTYSLVTNNRVVDLTNSNAGGTAYGIYAYLLGSHAHIENNVVLSIANTNTDGAGIYIAANSYSSVVGNRVANCSQYGIKCEGTSTIVNANYCYNNGSDSGIANTNGHNFSDTGTGSQVSSNSWQQPVTSEPSVGTWHPHYQAIWTTASATTASTSYITVTSTQVPIGTKAIDAWMYLVGTTGTGSVHLVDIAGGNYQVSIYIPTTGIYGYASGTVPISSTYGFKLVESTVWSLLTRVAIKGYYL